MLSPYEQTHLRRYKSQLLAAVVAGEYGEMPVEYVTGKVEFSDMVLHVDPRVLIPRVETEDLVDLVWLSIQRKYSSTKKIRVVEVGTGSGAIGLALWKRAVIHNYHNMEFHLLDISLEALTVAKLNLKNCKQELAELSSRTKKQLPEIACTASDLLQQWPLGQEITILVANLPYIPSQRIKKLDASVADYEPHLALDGGDDGLLYIHQLLNQAKSVLAKNGICWLEIDDSHNSAAVTAGDDTNPKWSCDDMADGFGKMRFARCILTK